MKASERKGVRITFVKWHNTIDTIIVIGTRNVKKAIKVVEEKYNVTGNPKIIIIKIEVFKSHEFTSYESKFALYI
jgi:hypothetical protein